jgi:putative transposase
MNCTWSIRTTGHGAWRSSCAVKARRWPAARIHADAPHGHQDAVLAAAHDLPARGGSIYPYLLDGLAIERPNQVWSSDISYLPMAHGFLYLVAILDVASRKVLSFRLSNTMSSDFCVRALQEALEKYGTPEIFNTDQGAQFTSEAWLEPLRQLDVRISMDRKGRWIDNVFIERLWRTVKYENVYFHAYRDGREAREGLQAYFEFYNARRIH